MTLTIDLPGLLPSGLNVLLRQHWTKRGREKKNVAEHVFAALVGKTGTGWPLTGPLRLTYTRLTCRWMDYDNAASSAKHVLDALVNQGVLEDDSPKVIAEFVVKQKKVPHLADQGTLVEIDLIQ